MANRNDDPGKFFVGNLSWDTDNDSLWNYFSQYGELSDAVVIMDRQTGRSRGFGFVTFRDPRCVDSVLNQGQHSIDGRQVSLLFFLHILIKTQISAQIQLVQSRFYETKQCFNMNKILLHNIVILLINTCIIFNGFLS